MKHIIRILSYSVTTKCVNFLFYDKSRESSRRQWRHMLEICAALEQ